MIIRHFSRIAFSCSVATAKVDHDRRAKSIAGDHPIESSIDFLIRAPLALPMRAALALLVLGTGCHAVFHPLDPLHQEIKDIVSIHDQGEADGYGQVTRTKLTQAGASSGNPSALILHTPTTMTLDGVRGDRLCFSRSRNMSAVNGVEQAKADARSRSTSHYAYLYFHDLKDVTDRIAWPAFAATKPLDVSTIGSEGVEGETHVDSQGDTRKSQDSIDVEIKLCGAIPVVPADAKWFAFALVYPYDQEENNRVMLWQITDEPSPSESSPEPQPNREPRVHQAEPDQPPAEATSIVSPARDALVATGKFPSFVAAVDNAKAWDRFAASAYTIFAPTEEAFAALPEKDRKYLMTTHSGMVAVVWGNHVVYQKLTRAQIAKEVRLATHGGQREPITKQGKQLLIAGAVIGEPIEIPDGVIYPIDKVLQ